MDRFNVKGIAGFDGDYPIDIGTFSMRELHIIKGVSGVRAGELEEAFGAGDTDVILGVAVVAVRRNDGDFQKFQALAWESEMGALTFIAACKLEGCDRDATNDNNGYCESHSEDDEGTAGEAVPLNPTPPQDSGNSEATPDDSGNASSSDGEDNPETSQAPTGDLRLATGAA